MRYLLGRLAGPSLGLALGLALAAASPLLGQPSKDQQGVLRIEVEGKVVGTERYQIVHAGSTIRAQAEIQLEVAGETVRQNTSLVLSRNYELLSYEWRLEKPRKSFVRIGMVDGRARVTFPRPDGTEEEQQFDFGTDRMALLDNNVFHHFLLLAHLYDAEKGGPQTIRVFVPQSVQPGVVTMEAKGVETVEVNGKKVLARRLEITTEDNQVLLWISDEKGIVRLQVPQSHVIVQLQD